MEFPNTVINAPAGQAAIRHKLRGVNSTVCAGFASGLHAIHYGAEFLRFGRAAALLAGGVEELCEESVNGFSRTGVLSPSGRARPMCADRDGAVPGEGAALWMIETEEAALARGRSPWLEICGFGCGHDARGIFGFDPRGSGAAEAIRRALDDSGIGPPDVACVIASASGSRAGDEMEARALEAVFGRGLARLPVCAPKAAFGEAMGASGALCAVAAGLALLKQEAPPTAGFLPLGARLPLSPVPVPISGEYALVNAFSCDGNNAALVVRLWKN
jgi:3-oxoacyl-(acyl-carrier-protein) synthase